MSAYRQEDAPVVEVPNLTNPHANEGFLLDTPDAHPGAERLMPPIVAFGGLFTVPEYHFVYGKLTGRDTTSTVPGRERFITPLNRGRGQVEAMRRDTNERVLRLHDRIGEKIYGVGHSLGGLSLTRAVLDNPEVFAGVTCVAGAQAGIRKHTLATAGLRLLAGNPDEATLLNHDSSFMLEHLARIEEEWPVDVPLDIVSTSMDPVIVAPQGFGLNPRGQEPTKRLVVSSWHALNPFTRRILGKMPDDIKPLYSTTLVEHVNIVRSSVVLDHIDRRRAAIANTGQPGVQAVT